MSNCIWNTPAEDRHCEYCCYMGGCDSFSFSAMEKSERSGLYVSVMNEVMGCDIRNKCRRQDLVAARNIVVHTLAGEGFSESEIADAVGLKRPTIFHCRHNAEYVLSMPSIYRKEAEIWRKFKEMLHLQKR